MKVFVTGVGGFVGQWLKRELTGAGHVVVGPNAGGPSGRFDVRDPEALRLAFVAAGPDAVVHLAAVSSSTQAAADPQGALEVAVGGTLNLMEVIGLQQRRPAAVLVVGSSEVYGSPSSADLPLNESSMLRPRTSYALAKAGQESVALAYAARLGLPLVVARSFSHIGPGQRSDFVVPALASRVLAVREGRASVIPVGNLDVRRDFSDVRDFALAYRMLLEALASAQIGRGGVVLNVCSGESVSIRQIVDWLCALAGVRVNTSVERELVREGEPEEIRGDASALRSATGWRPQVALEQTMADIWNALVAEAA